MSILGKYKVYSATVGWKTVMAATQQAAVASVPGGKFAHRVITPPAKPAQGASQPSPTGTPGIKPSSGGSMFDLIKPEITIGATSEEMAKAAGKGCPTPINTYKLKLRDGGIIYVEALSKKAARGKAESQGYDVAWVTKAISSPTGEILGTKPKDIMLSVKDGETGEMLQFPKDSWDAWPGKYQALVKSEGLDTALREFKSDYYELGDGQFMLKTDFYALPTEYADIAATKGFTAMQQAFESDHIKLGDGQWVTGIDWEKLIATDKELGTNFTEIGKKQGYDAMVTAIDKANEPYKEFLEKVEQGDIIPVAGDEYITKAEYGKLPSGTQQILKEQGFEALAKATTITYERIPKPIGVGWDPRYKARLEKWESLPQTITQEEMNKIPFSDKGYYQVSKDSQTRAGLLILSSLIPPAKAALPEYTTRDISAMDWGIAAAQAPLIVLGFAPAAISGSVVGRVAMVTGSTALSGMIGYGTVKNWSALTLGQKAMGVGMAALCAVPFITTVARNVKISGTPIPTTKGNAVVWKGLSVAGHPLIGRSGGKWVLGTRSITLPEARLILNGYKPEMMLETKVFVNRSALSKAGFSKTQIDYLATTLKNRNLFAGKTSPWLDKNVLIEPTARLNANEIGIVMKRLIKLEQGFIKAKKIKDAFLLYGSPTIKSQLAPNLRNWRSVHDWDISLNMNQAQTEAFTKALLRDFKAKGGGTYRISPQSTTLIEKKIGNTWTHIADIHSQQAAITSTMDLPASKLDATGTYSYGRMVSEPAITVKYPGVGELRIMKLSESGVRKADTILRVRQTGQGTAFRPPERGIAQPGVPKDAADFYVTLRTFKGATVAEDWLKSWAKSMGYTDDWLKAAMLKARPGTYPPKLNWNDWVNTTLSNEMINVSSQTPSSIIGYEFKPSGTAQVSPGASPSIIVHMPSSLGASVSGKLESQISQPIYPYKLSKSPEMQATISAGLSAMLSKAPSKAIASPKILPSVAWSLAVSKASPKPSPSPTISKVPSPSTKPSPSTVPSVYPSGKPSPSTKPSKAPSGILSPKPSPVPSPSPKPSPFPYPSPKPEPKPRPKPKPLPIMSMPESKKQRIRQGPALAVWRQGAYWVSVFPPFRTTGLKEDVVYSRKKPPWGSVIARGRHSPRVTLRSIGKVPELIEVPMGVVTARIRNGRKLTFSHSNHRKRGRVVY